MMKPTVLIVAALSAVALLSGCGAGGTASGYKPEPRPAVPKMELAPGDEKSLMPVAQGKSWIYEGRTQASGPGGGQEARLEVTFQISKVEESPNGQVVTIDVLTGTRKTDQFVWRLQQDGIFQLSGQFRDATTQVQRSVSYNPPLRIVQFPIKESESLKQAVNGARPGANPGAMNVTLQNQGVQEVDTAMGPMSAMATQTVSTYREANAQFQTTATSWWVKNVGMVRYRQEITALTPQGQRLEQVTTLQLKSHSK